MQTGICCECYKRFINRTGKPIPQIEDSEVEIGANSGEDYLPTFRDPPAVKCILCFREVFVSVKNELPCSLWFLRLFYVYITGIS
jgi:hypothetical protein